MLGLTNNWRGKMGNDLQTGASLANCGLLLIGWLVGCLLGFLLDLGGLYYL